jgi:hypothetical protein
MLFSSFKRFQVPQNGRQKWRFFFFIIFRDLFEREINTPFKKKLKGEHTAAAAKR